MAGPLEGIRVVDCTIWMQGPLACAILGDLGADVIKIEQKGYGDPIRGFTETYYQSGQPQRQAFFEMLNRNKRGIALDLMKEHGKAIAYKLIASSDIFIHNLRSKASTKLGLDYETLSKLNPRLVYGQASGWGGNGADSQKGAYDAAAGARAGLMYATGEPDAISPQRTISGISDTAGGICLALGTLAALQARERSGHGQVVETSIFGSTILAAAAPITIALAYGIDQPLNPRWKARNPLSNFYRCADGEWLYLVMMQATRYWNRFCGIVGRPDLVDDPRCTSMSTMAEHSEELVLIIDEALAAKPRSEWIRILAESDMPCAPIQKVTDLANDEQALLNDYVLEYDHPRHGPGKMVGFPYRFGETPAAIRLPAPEYGEHTEQILLEIGYRWDQIEEMKQEGII